VDVTGQSGSGAPANANGNGNGNGNGHGDGYPAGGWVEGWSGAGSALEPEADSVVPAWRRGMDALNHARAQTPPRYAEMLAEAGVRPLNPPAELPEDEDPLESPMPPFRTSEFGGFPADVQQPVQPIAEMQRFPETPRFEPPYAEPQYAERPPYEAQPPAPSPSTPTPPVNGNTPPNGTPSPFARLLEVPSVPSAPPAPRASTYPPAASPQVPVPPYSAPETPAIPQADVPVRPAPLNQSAPPAGPGAYAPERVASVPSGEIAQPSPAGIALPAYHRVEPIMPMDLEPPRGLAERLDPADPRPPAPPGLRPQATSFPSPVDPIDHSGLLDPRRQPLHPQPPEHRPAMEPPAEPPASPLTQRHRAEPSRGLPQRVPSEPDVPRIAEPTTDPPAPAPALSRIASGLRRDDPPPSDRPDGFDVAAVLSAVRDVPGVRDAQLRATATGGHTLRLDLADGSDPAYVSRVVARMLNERMGLVAQPPPPPPTALPSAIPPTAPPEESPRTSVPAQPAGPTEPRPDRTPAPPAQRGSSPPLPPGLVPASAAPREPRRRHPVTMRGRYPGELRPGDRFGRPDEPPESGRSRALTPPAEAARVVLDHVQVSTFGLDATVEVRLVAGDRVALGVANGPAVDGYVLRLCAAAAANAVDELLSDSADGQTRGHCYVEQAAIVPMGSCEVAVVVVLLVGDGWVEQLAGSALVSGDPRQAVVRATLAAVNRRLSALLP
jgi:hypothetical protein